MSNIYYKEKKSIFEETFQFSSDSITFENISKVLKSTYIGIRLVDPNIPYPSTSWRTAELYYDHKDFGLIYIPKNIHFTDGNKHYFIVLIDSKIEIVNWIGFNSATKDLNEKINCIAITEEEFKKIELSFYNLIDYLGINKSIEEHYKKVKGVKLNLDSVSKLIEAFSPEKNNESLIDNVFKAAVKPVLFFKENTKYLQQLEIDEPSKELYLLIFISELEINNKLQTLDWKSSPSDINYAISCLSNNEIVEILDAKDTQKSTPKMLKTASEKLQQKGLKLLNICTDTDSYSIVLVQENKADDLIQIAKECKIKITAY